MGNSIKVPKKMNFAESVDNTKAVQLSGEDGARTLVMKAHSGKPMKHYYYGKMAVDTSGVKFKGKRFPVLNQHWLDEKIGSSEKLVLHDDHSLHLDSESFKFVNSEHATEFIDNSDNGFPYQASISIQPLKVEKLSEGTSAEVNGYTLKGPALIIRESDYAETSVCVWGRDSNTSSKAGNLAELSEDDYMEIPCKEIALSNESNTNINNEEGSVSANKENVEKGAKITLKQLQENNPDLIKEIAHNGEESTGDIAAQLSEIATAVGGLTSKMTVMEANQFKLSEKTKMKDTAEIAESIYTKQFSDAGMPERFCEKIRKVVKFKSHVSKEGEFNKDSFSEALAEELKGWAEFSDNDDNQVDGGVPNGSNKRNNGEVDLTDDAADDLFGMTDSETDVNKVLEAY